MRTRNWLWLFLLSSGSALSNVSTGLVKIKYVESWTTDNGMFVQTFDNATNPTNPANCSFPGQYYLKNEASEILRTLILSAAIQKVDITLGIASGSCADNNRPIIVSARIAN